MALPEPGPFRERAGGVVSGHGPAKVLNPGDTYTEVVSVPFSASSLAAIFTAAQGGAWDHGFDTAARASPFPPHKPRNPHTGEMNDDDPAWYCHDHGGLSAPEVCRVPHEGA